MIPVALDGATRKKDKPEPSPEVKAAEELVPLHASADGRRAFRCKGCHHHSPTSPDAPSVQVRGSRASSTEQ